MATKPQTKRSLHTPSSQGIRLPIVGVVASAGGLDAFKKLLSAVSVDCEMAFVLVPHLDPKYESQMVGILSKVSLLPVVEIVQGMVAEANHVYVIPSKNFLTIDDGVFHLSEPPTPQGREIAIDFFLRSLAKDQGERSIGIVLSGTGSHGTLGIRDIKLAGGMAIAQQLATAEFDSMPSSIITGGLADYVLAPAEMPATLMNYIRQPYINSVKSQVPVASTEDEQLSAILAHLRLRVPYDFGSYRKNMILRRIQRRMGLFQLERLEQYVEYLDQNPKEVDALCKDLLISVTAFFRDAEAYQSLSRRLLDEFSSRDGARFPYRVWVPGCATGEEAYSLAMLMFESLAAAGQTAPKPIQVFASDVDESAIAVARTGVYPSSIGSDVSEERLERFFVKTDDAHYKIGKQLRDSIVFSRQNMINEAPFSKLDLISCRNVLIYLEPEMQQKIIRLFHFALADHGVLMLGPSESIAGADDLFESISEKWRIFKKLPSRRRTGISIPLFSSNDSPRRLPHQSSSASRNRGLRELVEKTLISRYAPATALINRRYEVLYVSGPLVNYMEFPSGEPNQNLLAMCRPGLRTKLRFACQKSVTEEADSEIEAPMKRGKDSVVCAIHVRVLKTRLDSEPLLLVSLSDKPLRAQPSGQSGLPMKPVANGSSSMDQLERELKSNSEELRGVIDELEGANEDLMTSNEEVMSMNEELQSANEELETSKEELQSLNEEISTVNQELLEKVTELDVANNDILNLIASTEIATLFLDDELLIQRFTPPTVELLNLRSTDIGRPMSDITTRFIDDCLVSDCRKVIEDSVTLQTEIEGENARLYLRRITPYRSHGDRICGVVVTFVDLTDRLMLEKSLKESKEHLEAILNSAADAILTIDDGGIVASLNPATERLFGYSSDDFLGKSVLLLLNSASDKDPIQLPSILNLSMSTSRIGNYHQQAAIRKDGSRFDAELTVSRIDHLSLFILVIRDVSKRNELQTKILEIASDEQRRIGQELHDGTQQELTGLSLIAGTIEEFLNDKFGEVNEDRQSMTLQHEEFERLISSASKLVKGLKQANQHVQSLSHGIMPVQIDAEGLQVALAELVSETNVEGQVVCHFVHSGSLSIESNAFATHLYRIAQEAINNAQRHGKAREIRVTLTGEVDQIELEIRDDGIGLAASRAKSGGKLKQGAGMQIMKFRANAIGGVLCAVTGKNNGTIVRCTLPRQRTSK